MRRLATHDLCLSIEVLADAIEPITQTQPLVTPLVRGCNPQVRVEQIVGLLEQIPSSVQVVVDGLLDEANEAVDLARPVQPLVVAEHAAHQDAEEEADEAEGQNGHDNDDDVQHCSS